MKKSDVENKMRSAFDAVSPDKLDSVLMGCAHTLEENRMNKVTASEPVKAKRQKLLLSAASVALVALCISTAFIMNGRRTDEHVIGSVDSTNGKISEGYADTEDTANETKNPTEDGKNTVEFTGGANCPTPEPEFRSLQMALDDTYRCLADRTNDPQYAEKDADYIYAWLGEAGNEDVYYVSYCIGEYRIDCTVPKIYKNDIYDVTISNFVESTSDEEGYIGKSAAKRIAWEDADVKEGTGSTLNVVLDRYKETPSYLVSFYCNGTRYYYELDAVTGEVLCKLTYDHEQIKDALNEKYPDPEHDMHYLNYDYIRRMLYETVGSRRNYNSLSVQRDSNEQIYGITAVDGNGSCVTEMTELENHILFYMFESGENTDPSINTTDIDAVMGYSGIWEEEVLSVECVPGSEEKFDVTVMTDKNVYKFGIDTYKAHEDHWSTSGKLTYFSSAPVGAADGVKLSDMDSALDIALHHAGVTDYTLTYSNSVKNRVKLNPKQEYAFFCEFIFTSGEYTYKYCIDFVSGEVLRYLSGSGKGDVSDVTYTVGDISHTSKKEIAVLFDDVKDEFAAWFDGAKLNEIWYDYEKLSDVNSKYSNEKYGDYWIMTVGIRFTTDADYNGNYGLEPNTEYEMYCIVYNNMLINWKALEFVHV